MVNQNLMLVTVEPDASGRWRVHLRKGPGVAFGQHPELLSTEAEALARDINNAAAECRRKNVRANLP